MGDSPCRLRPQPRLAACTGQRSGHWDVPSQLTGSRSQLLSIRLQLFLAAAWHCRCVSVRVFYSTFELIVAGSPMD